MAKKPQLPSVFIDSCVFMDLIVREATFHKDTGEERWKSAREVLKAVTDGRITLATSALVEAEVMCNGNVRQSANQVRTLVRGWFDASSVAWSDVDRVLAREAVRVLNNYRGRSADSNKMKSADALHLAAAIRLKCDYFMTHDEGFPISERVEGVHIVRPQPVWQPSLLEESDL